jgi:hypothetical protein
MIYILYPDFDKSVFDLTEHKDRFHPRLYEFLCEQKCHLDWPIKPHGLLSREAGKITFNYACIEALDKMHMLTIPMQKYQDAKTTYDTLIDETVFTESVPLFFDGNIVYMFFPNKNSAMLFKLYT